MPARKRSSECIDEDDDQNHEQYEEGEENNKNEGEKVEEEEEEEDGDEVEEGDDEAEDGDDENNNDQERHSQNDEDSEGSQSSIEDKDTEFIAVKLSDVRKEVQCLICLGIIRKTRTVMECLHRFCRECIDKSMRLGNNECPACRTHCASRRSLRDDPNYDALIAALYPDIDQYEAEELAFHEGEKARNRQIQASIAQTFRRQSEALGKRRNTAKATAAAFIRRSRRGFRNTSYLRGRTRRGRESARAGSNEDEEDASGEGDKYSFHADESALDVRHRRESASASPVRAGSPEVLVWGKGGTRSHTRYGSLSGSNGKIARKNRLSKIMDYLRNLDENPDEFDVHVTLLPLDDKLPGLQQPYLSCRPTLSVRHLCQFIAQQISVQAEELDIFIKDIRPTICQSGPSVDSLASMKDTSSKSKVLSSQETLAVLRAHYTSHRGNLVLVYGSKLQKS